MTDLKKYGAYLVVLSVFVSALLLCLFPFRAHAAFTDASINATNLYFNGFYDVSGTLQPLDKKRPLDQWEYSRAYYQLYSEGTPETYPNGQPVKPGTPKQLTYELHSDGEKYERNQSVDGARWLWVLFPGDKVQFEWSAYGADGSASSDSSWSTWVAYNGYFDYKPPDPRGNWMPDPNDSAPEAPLSWHIDNHGFGNGRAPSTDNNGSHVNSSIVLSNRKDAANQGGGGLNPIPENQRSVVASTIDLQVKPDAIIPPGGEVITLVHWSYQITGINEGKWVSSGSSYFIIMPETVEARLHLRYDTSVPDNLNTRIPEYEYRPEVAGNPYSNGAPTITINVKNLMRDPGLNGQLAYRPGTVDRDPNIYLSLDYRSPGPGYTFKKNPDGTYDNNTVVPETIKDEMGNVLSVGEIRKEAVKADWLKMFTIGSETPNDESDDVIKASDRDKVYKVFQGPLFGYVLKYSPAGRNAPSVWHLDFGFREDTPNGNYMLEINAGDSNVAIATKAKAGSPLTEADLFSEQQQGNGLISTYFKEVISNYSQMPGNPVTGTIIGGPAATHGDPYGFSYNIEDDNITVTYFRDAVDGSGPTMFTTVFKPHQGTFDAPKNTGNTQGSQYAQPSADGTHSIVVPVAPGLPNPGPFGINSPQQSKTITSESLLDYYEYPGGINVCRLSMETNEIAHDSGGNPIPGGSKLGTLAIGNSVAGNAGDIGKDYTFTVTAGSDCLDTVKNMQLPITYSDGRTDTTVQFDVNGVAQITLKHGQTATLSVPEGTYSVAEVVGEVPNITTEINLSIGQDEQGQDVWQTKSSIDLSVIQGTPQNVKFKNTSNAAPQAGLENNVHPFVLMIVLSFIALVALGGFSMRSFIRKRGNDFGEE